MANIPFRKINISDYEQQGQARLKQLAPSLDASIYGSFITNLVRAFAASIYPATYLVEDAFNNAFVQYAMGDVLDDYHGKQEGVERIPAAPASGNIIIYAPIGSVIPIGTSFVAGSSSLATTNTVTIGERSTNITNAVAQAGLVTVTTATNHYQPVGGSVTIITGDVDFDGDYVVTSSTDLTFQYQIANQNPLSVTGGLAKSISNMVAAETNDTGASVNVAGNIALSGEFEAYTLPDGLSGGADRESDDAYKDRIVTVRGLLEGVFTRDQIILAAKRIAGNTRAWVVSPVYEVSGGSEGAAGYKPQPGQVCVYFVRDNDLNILPNSTIIAQTKQSVLDYGKLPAHSLERDVFVMAPLLNQVTFTINSLTPDSPEMRNAIESELRAYIEDFVDFEQGMSVQIQNATIAQASVSGIRPTSFNNTTPAIAATSGTLVRYGGVTWA